MPKGKHSQERGNIMGYVTPKGLCYERAVAHPIPLDHCPFCGDEAVLEPHKIMGKNAYFVNCVRCTAKTATVFIKGSGERAELEAKIRACLYWNSRTPSEEEQQNERNKQVSDLVNMIIEEEAEREAERQQIIKEQAIINHISMA